MKTALTTIFLILIAFTAQANEKNNDIKAETITKSIVTHTNYNTSTARLYKFKNQKIKKELNFIFRKKVSKLA